MIAHQYQIREKKKLLEKNSLPFDISKISLDNTEIRQINKTTATKIITEYEWLKSMPLFSKYYFGIYFKVDNSEYLGGVVVYSDEYSANKTNIWKKYSFENKILLLSRGVCLWWTPKNTASFFITKTMQWIKYNTGYKIITATVDPAAGEIGTIYQSLNWHYVGLMRGNYSESGKELTRFSVFINGKLRHSRSVRKEFGTIKKDVILEKYPDAIFVKQYRKRRYFYFIGDKRENKLFYNNIKHLILPYPKRDIDFAGIIYMITNSVNNKKYIGQTTRSLNDRIDDYRHGVGCNPYIVRAFNKYGFDNFIFETIDTAETLNDLNNKEIFYIKKYDTTNRKLGYNIETGGRNSSASEETRLKLSLKRKEIKQNKEWIMKRTESVSKKVIKYDKTNKLVLEKYNSLADAGKYNRDGLSYTQINRKCLGLVKNEGDIIWCYEENMLDGNFPQPPVKNDPIKTLDSFNDHEMEIMYGEYKSGTPMREISRNHNITFSTLQKFISNKDGAGKCIIDKDMVAICKKTGKVFNDSINKSGCLTNHIKELYPDMVLPSKFLRKKVEIETGKPWYYEYFEFKQE